MEAACVKEWQGAEIGIEGACVERQWWGKIASDLHGSSLCHKAKRGRY